LGHLIGHEKHLVFSETSSNAAAGSASHRGVHHRPRPAPPTAFKYQAIARIGGDQLTAQGLALDRPGSAFAMGGDRALAKAGRQAVSRDISPPE
jgi:hypothetical protein